MILVIRICGAAEQVRFGLDADERGGDSGFHMEDGARVLEHAYNGRRRGYGAVGVPRETDGGVVIGNINRVLALISVREMKAKRGRPLRLTGTQCNGHSGIEALESAESDPPSNATSAGIRRASSNMKSVMQLVRRWAASVFFPYADSTSAGAMVPALDS